MSALTYWYMSFHHRGHRDHRGKQKFICLRTFRSSLCPLCSLWLSLLTLIALLTLAACAGRGVAPVSDQGASLRQPESKYREVRAGDTLYSIAWESGRDYRELASWNGIAPPYVIKPGQKLRLYPPEQAEAREKTETTEVSARPDAAPAYHVVRRRETLTRIAAQHDVSPKDLAAWNKLSPPYTLKPGQKLRLAAPQGAAPAENKVVAGKADKKTPGAADRHDAGPARSPKASGELGPWVWPTEGTILARFSAKNPSKGIDIGGKAGQPIVAAAPGTVVYRGGGLRGYGQLIIIKHNADFLSAYAHSDKIYVKEGNVIKRGQKIAEMGSSGADRVKLHFEIRRRGVPVDPMEYLPRK